MSYEKKQHNGFMVFGQNTNPKAVPKNKKKLSTNFTTSQKRILA